MQSIFLYFNPLGNFLSKKSLHMHWLNKLIYIARVSTLFFKNSLIIRNYKIGPHKINLLKYPSFYFIFFRVLQSPPLIRIQSSKFITNWTNLSRFHFATLKPQSYWSIKIYLPSPQLEQLNYEEFPLLIFGLSLDPNCTIIYLHSEI